MSAELKHSPAVPQATPIADYGVIGNGFSCALVSSAGSVDWLCWPAFDSPSIFAALLDLDDGGRFLVTPVKPILRTRSDYLGISFVLQHQLWTEDARLTRTELMAGYELNRQALMRCVQVMEGSAEIYIYLDLRPNYALQRVTPAPCAGGFRLGNYYFVCPDNVAWKINPEGTLEGRVSLQAGESLMLALANTPGPWHFPSEMHAARDWWEGGPPIVGRDSRYGRVIERSVQIIHLLTYRPTGALIAAPTTSLPEKLGGERNYDYRYVWLRDMAFVMLAMLPRGQFQQATKRLLDWLVMSCVNPREHVPIMFTIDVKGEVNERILSHLEGYAGSRPVRVGNEAIKQFQLDAYGELLIAVKLYSEHAGQLERGWWPLLTRLADALCKNWFQPDSGIWEERAMPRQYLYSKAMTWVGLRAAIEIALKFRLPGNQAGWQECAARIRIYIDEHYWNADKGAYVSVEGGHAVDPSALLLGLYDYLPVTDPRLRQTAQIIESELCEDGLLYRRLEDESGRVEGTFNLCTLWLVIYWARAGERERARKLFERFLKRGNSLNLYSEEIDAVTGVYLGNYPQLFVHAAIIVAADALEQPDFPAGEARPHAAPHPSR
jgi:GH15 family glucan-1,4-alpha-glucosidase